MPYVNVETEVWIDLEEFDDEDISEEYHRRNLSGGKDISLDRLYELKRTNSPEFDRAFDEYCWEKLGRSL